jgi:ABC-type sugar transport system substrate-binding protein
MPDVIGLFLRSADNAFQKRLAEVGSQVAKRHGFTLHVESVQFDPSEQVAQIRKAIKSAAATHLIAVLVSGVRDMELAPVAQEAAESGLDWALLNEGSFIDDIRRQNPKRAVFAATCDQSEIGQIQAEQLRMLVRPGGKVLCVTGHLGNVAARLRLEGLKQAAADDFDLVEINADWTSEGARRAIEAWAPSITAKDDFPTALVAQNDEMALGVRQALRDIDCRRDWNIASVPILGCDGAKRFGQRLVREGRLKATVIMPPASGAAIEWIARARKSGEIPPVRVLLPALSFPNLSRIKT